MRVAALAVLLLLSACGFQLQGRRVMPASLAVLHLEAVDEQSDFTRALRNSLKASGARLVDGSAAAAVVRILRDEFTERTLSVDARNIPTDYELIYKVEVNVRAGGAELLAAQHFELSKTLSADERKLLGKEREKDIVREALSREMASMVTRRLSAL